ncbi:MAG: class I SAM-dependent methyltransferase [Bernardetiaceae bacterium]|nr:class I SAM-dependent methyltransferase [Bernardetiaceae bacterium]
MSKKHFDTIAAHYDEDIPTHVRKYLVEKKTALMRSRIPKGFQKGLDIGCGTGHHLHAMQKAGFDMKGTDFSAPILAQAALNSPNTPLFEADMRHIPLPTSSLDFAYTITALHHLPDAIAQKEAVAEAIRLLRPGGLFFIHELNCDAFWVKFYMEKIYPLSGGIDEGDECWVSVRNLRQWQKELGFEIVDFYQCTFIPHNIHKSIFPFALRLERWLEKISKHKAGAHYLLSLQKKS